MIEEGLEARHGAVQVAELGDAALAQRARGQLLTNAFEHAARALAEQRVDEEQKLLAVVEQDGVERGAGAQPIERSVRQQPARYFFSQESERSSAVLALERLQDTTQKPASQTMIHVV